MPRNQSIEILRIVAAFGIVCFHTSGLDVPYAGLIAFAVLTSYFDVGPNIARTRQFLTTAKQFLLPWLIWFSLFGLLNILMGKPVLLTDNGIILGILSGPSIHLWYLPFAFLAVIIIGIVKRFIEPSWIFITAFTGCVLLLLTVPIWRGTGFETAPPLGQYLHILFPFLAGLVLGLQGNIRFGWMASVILLCMTLMHANWIGIGVPYTIGLASVWLSTSIDFRSVDVEKISACMFGVYLCHPLFITINFYFGFERGLISGILAFICSTALIFCVRLLPPTAPMGKVARLAI